MEQDKKSSIGIIEKLALIADAIDNLFPNGKSAILFELDTEDFKLVQSNFRIIDQNYKQFKIEMSNTEFMFLERELSSDEKGSPSEIPSQPK